MFDFLLIAINRQEMSTEDVVVVEELNASRMKAKLFQFSENYRPAYYGTWQKRSRFISGRRPFAKDTKQLDYEVDSDDEWEEVEPGESLSHSEVETSLVLYENISSKVFL